MSERLFTLAECATAQAEVHSLVQPPADDPIVADAPTPDVSQIGAASNDGQFAPTGSERKDAVESGTQAHTVRLVRAVESPCNLLHDARRCAGGCGRLWHNISLKLKRRKYKVEGGYMCTQCYDERQRKRAHAAALLQEEVMRTPKKQRATTRPTPSCTPEQKKALHKTQQTEFGQRGLTSSCRSRTARRCSTPAPSTWTRKAARRLPRNCCAM